jgi:hypothetical protein
MKSAKAVFYLLAVSLVGVAAMPSARADESNKKTIVTFSQAVEVPGKVLPAGTYTFQLLESPSDRHIVQIFNADGTQFIVTILAINNYRLKPSGDTVMKFGERAGDSPEALRAWFYPGDNFGQEFVYPKARAIQLALTTKEIVPAVAVETIDDTTIKTIPIVAVTPDEKEVEVNTAIQTTAPVEVVTTPTPVAAVTTPAPVVVEHEQVAVAPIAQSHETHELPQTAGSMPLIALLGGLAISAAVGLKLFLKLAS